MNEVNKVRSPQNMDSWKLITRADKPRISYPVYEFKKKGSLNKSKSGPQNSVLALLLLFWFFFVTSRPETNKHYWLFQCFRVFFHSFFLFNLIILIKYKTKIRGVLPFSSITLMYIGSS